jgi:hypothetical protein
MEPIAQRGRTIGAKAAALRMMGAHDAAERCVELQEAVNNRDLAEALVVYREKRGITHRKDTFERYRENINSARARLGEMVERELRTLNLPAPQDAED